ncbi:MAG: cytidylate kinase-like family protein [Muribaculaceae bacterium]|nr:cytidylate kinase-like family protein [Muribaculaceae bacterium]
MQHSDIAPLVITVGRQFGSGGRELGKLLADTFGMKYYDKELLADAARRAGLDPRFFEKSDERVPSFLDGLFAFSHGMSPMSMYVGSTSISDDSIYRAQSDFIEELAQRESCVIVGRTADYVLRDHPRVVSVFVHAPAEVCGRRIMSREPSLTLEKAIAKHHKINKLRSNYYNFYTDKEWGQAGSYDLTIDTSKLPMDAVVGVIRAYIEARFGAPIS